jgi:hypothetical protein
MSELKLRPPKEQGENPLSPLRDRDDNTETDKERPLRLTEDDAACRLTPALRGWTWAKHNQLQRIQENT